MPSSAAVRLQLTEDNHEDVHALADKADRCAASIHRHQQLLPVFTTTADNCEDTEEQSNYPVAAVGFSRGGRFSQGPKAAKSAPKAAEAASGLSPAPALPCRSPSRLASAATTSSKARRPTTGAATAPGWETKRCQRRLPGTPGLPQRPHHKGCSFSHPSWGTSAPKEPPEIPLQLQGASFIYSTFAAAVPNRRSRLLTAGHSPWFPAPRSSSFWT